MRTTKLRFAFAGLSIVFAMAWSGIRTAVASEMCWLCAEDYDHDIGMYTHEDAPLFWNTWHGGDMHSDGWFGRCSEWHSGYAQSSGGS